MINEVVQFDFTFLPQVGQIRNHDLWASLDKLHLLFSLLHIASIEHFFPLLPTLSPQSTAWPPFTARIQRAHSYRARCASKHGR